MTAAQRRDHEQQAPERSHAVQQGMELLGQGKLADAELAFTAALAKDQGSFEALQYLALIRLQQGRLLESLDFVNRALKQRRQSLECIAIQGVLLSRLDRNEEALESFDRFLAQQPGHVETLYNRGVALGKLGRVDEAIESYREALVLRPGHALAQFNLANLLAKHHRYDEALAGYDVLVSGGLAAIDVFNNRGSVLYDLGRVEDALADYERALALAPQHVEVLRNRCKALKSLGRHEQAVECYDRLLAVAPRDLEALCGRGSELLDLGRPQEALASYEAGLAIAPDTVDLLNGRCAALWHLGRFEDALDTANAAVTLDPLNAQAHFGWGNALQAFNRFEQAIECYQTSLMLGPVVAGNVHGALGTTLHALGRHDEAIYHFDQSAALGVKPEEAQANKALVYLALGQFAEGWREYDGRLTVRKTAYRNYSYPWWNGERVDGTLLVWGEQGLGDQILFASMVPDLMAYARSVVLEVEPRLVDLFARSFPGVRVVPMGDALYEGEAQAHVALGSIGRHLRPNADAFVKREQGYLVADPVRVAALRQRLASDGCKVVGLSWRSQSPKYEKVKSAPLLEFEPLLRLPGCRFVDLQYGDTREERELVERELGVRVEHIDEIDNTRDIDAVAALMQACDLVASVSNTPAHMAGAIGRPMWVFIPFGRARLWYWFRDRADSPWYPGARVRRQHDGQSWGELIGAHRDEIAAFLGTP
jgi:tetratricopeptide (TPR) repeat protein